MVPNLCVGQEERKAGNAGRFSLVLYRFSFVLFRFSLVLRRISLILCRILQFLVKNQLPAALQHATMIREKLLCIPQVLFYNF